MRTITVSVALLVPLLFVLSAAMAQRARAAPPRADTSCIGSVCLPGEWRRSAPRQVTSGVESAPNPGRVRFTWS
ncbi:hypothetical protein [Nocardia bovistercoris]|uniref:Secreted protein n=1 Tax=Nocardia bovistercoris TaxID=2785916 RepID=A0A931I5R6_9NOCA|nr:hypothetical protein [Nocardia bovistercoris]MBH0775364.1 hypothetical protein [Nocardia bovistercoris]